MIGIDPITGVFAGTWLLGGRIFSRQTAAVVGPALTAFRQGELRLRLGLVQFIFESVWGSIIFDLLVNPPSPRRR